VILALAGLIVMSLVLLCATFWTMPPETRIRQAVTVAVVVVAALFVGFVFDRCNKKNRPRTIIRFPGRW
jgi:hypothetical protein